MFLLLVERAKERAVPQRVIFFCGLCSALIVLANDRYWWVGLGDMKQEAHTLKRNFPVLANIR